MTETPHVSALEWERPSTVQERIAVGFDAPIVLEQLVSTDVAAAHFPAPSTLKRVTSSNGPSGVFAAVTVASQAPSGSTSGAS